jgi:hypothetical protein
MASLSPVAQSRDILPMSVANMTFLVNKLGEDCAPLQYVRELTQNAIESLTGVGHNPGQVIWDVYWPHFDLDGAYKLCCIDTGIGMTGPEMVKYINELSSSVHEQSPSGNFGVGAKISAAPKNPHGLVYMSWKGGVGHMIHLWFDRQEKVYGLKRWAKNNNEFWTPVSADLRPAEIKDNGTVVVLLGKSDEDNTMEPVPGTPMRSRWILRYLNTRYFRFPVGITVHAREGWEIPRADSRHNFLRQVEGQAQWLEKNSDSFGTIELVGARAYWWILKADIDRDSGHFAPGGHVAALFQNELYEMLYGRAGIARLQAFGAIFGTDRVVIYVEPFPTLDRPVTANTSRTQLLAGGEPLDWAAWSSQFREHMPDELVRLQEEIGAQAGEKDHKKAILERLRQIRDLLRFSRFRPSKEGAVNVEPDLNAGGDPAYRGGTRDGNREAGGKGGRAGDIYALFAESGTVSADPVQSFDEPKTQWVSLADHTRTPPDLDDRAAKFLLQQNLLMINGDFRVFTDMIDRWTRAYSHVPGARVTIAEVVHEWFEQQLIEAVMSAQALKETGKWSIQELESLWSESALTSAVLPRWHIDQSIKRNLGHRLGSLRTTAA